jgi:ribosomal protein S18 acetylase RimI-like enzyme
MTQADPRLRPAVPEDAPAIALLVNMASQGIALYFWEMMAAPGQDPWEVGKAQVLSDDRPFSYRNAIVMAADDDVIAAIVGFAIEAAESQQPQDHEDFPPIVRPLLDLEAEAVDSWFVQFLAVMPAHRGQGVGERLLAVADENARRHALGGCALVVSDANDGARRLYRRRGYREIARRKMVKQDWQGEGREWLLMRKPVR